MAVEESPRLGILKALTDYIKTMTVADYGFDLSTAVFRGITGAGDQRPKTAVFLLDSPRPDVARLAGEYGIVSHEGDWTVLAMGRIPIADVDNPDDDSYNLMWALQRHLAKLIETKPETGNPKYPTIFMLERKVAGIKFGPGIVRPPGDTPSEYSVFYLPIRLSIAGRVG